LAKAGGKAPGAVKAEVSFSLKDDLFNPRTVALLAQSIKKAHPRFDKTGFEREVLARFPTLELKGRIDCLVESLRGLLPQEVGAALDVLEAALPPPLDPSRTDDDFGAFIWVVPSTFAARYACSKPLLHRALAFLRSCTMRFSAEGALRPFINSFPQETLRFVQTCSQDSNYHVRRLASEGIRPLLPWCERAPLPEATIISVLDRLQADSTRFVTRSVANNLNDISKSNPELVLATLARWQKQGQQKPDELAWMIRHALRTLEKKDHPKTLVFLGYDPGHPVSVLEFPHAEAVAVGDQVTFEARLQTPQAGLLFVVLRIHYRKANGSLAPKSFTMKKARFASNTMAVVRKKVSFKPMTTRALYPGTHKAEIVVNGHVHATQFFSLVAASD